MKTQLAFWCTLGTLVVSVLLLSLVQLKIIEHDQADMVSILVPLLGPIMAVWPLLFSLNQLVILSKNRLHLATAIMATLVLTASIVYWVTLFLFFSSLKGASLGSS